MLFGITGVGYTDSSHSNRVTVDRITLSLRKT